jgi:hypothetical protein
MPGFFRITVGTARNTRCNAIETEAEGVDIWTPVAQQIGVLLEESVIEM